VMVWSSLVRGGDEEASMAAEVVARSICGGGSWIGEEGARGVGWLLQRKRSWRGGRWRLSAVRDKGDEAMGRPGSSSGILVKRSGNMSSWGDFCGERKY